MLQWSPLFHCKLYRPAAKTLPQPPISYRKSKRKYQLKQKLPHIILDFAPNFHEYLPSEVFLKIWNFWNKPNLDPKLFLAISAKSIMTTLQVPVVRRFPAWRRFCQDFTVLNQTTRSGVMGRWAHLTHSLHTDTFTLSKLHKPDLTWALKNQHKCKWRLPVQLISSRDIDRKLALRWLPQKIHTEKYFHKSKNEAAFSNSPFRRQVCLSSFGPVEAPWTPASSSLHSP